jgi:Domain of unknown function (DUF6894)
MPRFFFHIRSADQSLSLDELGLDLPNVETAYDETLRAAQDLEGVFLTRGQDPQDYAIQVENAFGELVVYLSFSEIFDRHRPPTTLRWNGVRSQNRKATVPDENIRLQPLRRKTSA